MQVIETAIRQFLAENYLYRDNLDAIAVDDSFLANGLIDSMGILVLVTFLETTFDIQVAEEEIVPENMDSIAQVSAYLRRKLQALPGVEEVVHAR